MAEVKRLGIGKKRIIVLLAGAVGVFVGSIPLHLYVLGVLSLNSPHLRPAPGYAAGDSLLGALGTETETVEDGVAPEPLLESGSLTAEASPMTGLGSSPSDGAPDEAMEVASSRDSETSEEFADASEISATESESEADDAPVESSATVTDSLGAESDVTEPLLPFDEAKLSRLVKVYEKMRPKQVALILSTMPDRQAVMILTHMKDKDAAEVLAELEPGKAARISQILVNWSTDEP